MPFAKGESGNPGGRPKGTSLTSELRKLLEEKVAKGEFKGKTNKRALAEVMLQQALAGDAKFAKEILDRADGKVADRHEFGGTEGEDMKFTFKFVT